MRSSSIEPLQSCFEYTFIRWPYRICFKWTNWGILWRRICCPRACRHRQHRLSQLQPCPLHARMHLQAVHMWVPGSGNDVSWVQRNMYSYHIIAHFAVSTEQSSECQTCIRFLNACDAPPRGKTRNWNANKRNDNQYSSWFRRTIQPKQVFLDQ